MPIPTQVRYLRNPSKSLRHNCDHPIYPSWLLSLSTLLNELWVRISIINCAYAMHSHMSCVVCATCIVLSHHNVAKVSKIVATTNHRPNRATFISHHTQWETPRTLKTPSTLLATGKYLDAMLILLFNSICIIYWYSIYNCTMLWCAPSKNMLWCCECNRGVVWCGSFRSCSSWLFGEVFLAQMSFQKSTHTQRLSWLRDCNVWGTQGWVIRECLCCLGSCIDLVSL